MSKEQLTKAMGNFGRYVYKKYDENHDGLIDAN